MKALILNSGIGSRMGSETKAHPKCMTILEGKETILGKQLRQLELAGVDEVVITTGYLNDMLENYCMSLNSNLNISLIYNPKYKVSNYIYSIYLARDLLHDDILLLHGDLVFSDSLLVDVIHAKGSCMAVDSNAELPEKDFKAVIIEGVIKKIGVSFFENAVVAQPLYKLEKKDWEAWLNEIIIFCERLEVNCYAENAFNNISEKCRIYPLDIEGRICQEIDTVNDWLEVRGKLNLEKSDYKFSTDAVLRS